MALQIACAKDPAAPAGGAGLPSLASLAGSCTVTHFEFWSVDYPIDPPVRLLYDAAANGYAASLRIVASSRTSGTYVFSASANDPYGLGEMGSGSLTLVGADSLAFSGSRNLPGATLYAAVGAEVTLTSPQVRTVTWPPTSRDVTVRITCQR